MRETVRDIEKLSGLLKDGVIYYSNAVPAEKERIIRTIFSELTINGETLQFKCKNGFKAFETPFIPNCEQHRDRPRTRVRQILDIFMGVAAEEINPVVTKSEHMSATNDDEFGDELQFAA